MKKQASEAARDLPEYPFLASPLLLSLATSHVQQTLALDETGSKNSRVRSHLEPNICDAHQFVEETMGLQPFACFAQHIGVDMTSLPRLAQIYSQNV